MTAASQMEAPLTSTDRPRAAQASVGHAVAHGMLWFMGQNAASRIVQAASQIMLAWLLVPADFGLISLTLTVSGVVATAFQLGLDEVVLQRRHKMRLWFGTLFWLSIGTAVLCFLVLVAAAPAVARIYGHPQLTGLLMVVALSVPIRSFSMVPVAIMRGRLDFRLLSTLNFSEMAAVSLATLGLAALGFGAYSFALPIPFGAAIFSVAGWMLTRSTIPRRRANFRWIVLLPKSLSVSGARLISALIGQGDALVLGLVASDVRIGLYFFAYRIAAQPVRLMGSSVGGVLFPALVHLSSEPQRQRDVALNASQVLAIVVMPICFIQAAMARPFVELVFSDQWDGAVVYIQILSIGLAFDCVSWVIGGLLPANGRFKHLILYAILNACVFLVLIIVGALISADYGVALGVAAYFALFQPCVCYTVVNKVAPVPVRKFAAVYLVPALPAALGAFGSAYLVAPLGPAAELLIAPILTLSFFGICMWWLAPGPLLYMIERLKALRGRGH